MVEIVENIVDTILSIENEQSKFFPIFQSWKKGEHIF